MQDRFLQLVLRYLAHKQAAASSSDADIQRLNMEQSPHYREAASRLKAGATDRVVMMLLDAAYQEMCEVTNGRS